MKNKFLIVYFQNLSFRTIKIIKIQGVNFIFESKKTIRFDLGNKNS